MTAQFESKSWAGTGLTTRLGIEYPIIQRPLEGLSSQCLQSVEAFSAGAQHALHSHNQRPLEGVQEKALTALADTP